MSAQPESSHGSPDGGEPTESLLHLVADSVPALMAYYDIKTLRCRFANRRYAEYNGWTPQTILGKTVREAIGEAAWQVIEPHVKAVSNGQTVKYTRKQILPDGGQRMIEVNLIPHFSEAECQVGAFVLINDITDQWRAQQAARDSEIRMRKFVEATDEGLVFHKDGVITDVNAALLRLSGYTREELLGRQTVDFIPEAWRQTVIDYIQAAREDPYEAVVTHRSGREIPVEIVGKTMPFNGEAYRLAVVRDITVRKQTQERIEFLALHDPLTQLPNRMYLGEHMLKTLALAQRQQGTIATLFIDLDDFKEINDLLGHHVGDLLLREVARRLMAAVRQADLVSRLGGDEFLVVLRDIAEPGDVARVAVTLLETIRSSMVLEGHTLSVTPSIGISLFPEDGHSADELIRHADLAMYRAKAGGGGSYKFFAPDMRRGSES